MNKSYFEQHQEINNQVEKDIIKLFNDNCIEEMIFPNEFHWTIVYTKYLGVIESALLRGIVVDEDTLSILIDDDTIPSCALLVGMLAELYPYIINEFIRRKEETEKQVELVHKRNINECEQRVFMLKRNIKYKNDYDFSAKSLMYGKVLTFDEFNSLNGLNDFNFKVLPYNNECVEMCPHCEHEVVLKSKFEEQMCPICNREILPCCLCEECTSDCSFIKR